MTTHMGREHQLTRDEVMRLVKAATNRRRRSWTSPRDCARITRPSVRRHLSVVWSDTSAGRCNGHGACNEATKALGPYAAASLGGRYGTVSPILSFRSVRNYEGVLISCSAAPEQAVSEKKATESFSQMTFSLPQ
jgi:hypothetical protein